MQYDTISNGDELYIYSKTTGYMKAWANETKGRHDGLALLHVTVNSKALPGIDQMRINTNTFDVYQADNPEVLKKIAETFVQSEWTR